MAAANSPDISVKMNIINPIAPKPIATKANILDILANFAAPSKSFDLYLELTNTESIILAIPTKNPMQQKFKVNPPISVPTIDSTKLLFGMGGLSVLFVLLNPKLGFWLNGVLFDVSIVN